MENKKLNIIVEKCPQNHKCPAVNVCPVGALSQEISEHLQLIIQNVLVVGNVQIFAQNMHWF